MGTTPILGLRYPELPAQADGPAAFLNLASDVESHMTNYISSGAYNGDLGIHMAIGTQATVFSADIPVVATGWAWLDVQFNIMSAGPQGGRNPVQIIGAVGGTLSICQNTTVLRQMRYHNHNRAETFSVNGAGALALPPATTLIQARVVVNVDSTSDSYGIDVVTYNVGVTQFGAAR